MREQLFDFSRSLESGIPAATLVPIPSLSLEAVLKCEHKCWSRLEQRKVIDELPNFGIVDLDDEHPAPPRGVGFPMWLKPVESFSSELAFKAVNEAEFAVAADHEDAPGPRAGFPGRLPQRRASRQRGGGLPQCRPGDGGRTPARGQRNPRRLHRMVSAIGKVGTGDEGEALVELSTLVGAMVLARAASGDEMSERILCEVRESLERR